jgi:hypothetical protein
MPRYAITERAGPFVAAHRNTGVGTVLELTERQAEHELRLGTLVALPAATREAAPVSAPEAPAANVTPVVSDTEAEPAPARKQKRSAT